MELFSIRIQRTFQLVSTKYIFTGVVVASLFKDMEDNKWLIYGLGFTSSILALIAGLVLTNKKKEDK